MDDVFARLTSFSQGPLGILGPVVEILLISLLVFVVINFMRGTRGAGVARGLTIVFLVGFMVVLFAVQGAKLENIRWIMENLVGVSVIAMFVIFQPEFRRGLIRLSEGVVISFGGEKPLSLDKELADAAVALSKRNEVGALFVIEREIKVGSCIESGILLDAKVSSALLRTIFTKNTPLHDGAVIIRQGKMVAANCLLPLSENIEVCRGMGTRHRAAIGLSEETDAVVVVVSEETGSISVAVGGQIMRDFDYEGLRAYLRENCFHEATGGEDLTEDA